MKRPSTTMDAELGPPVPLYACCCVGLFRLTFRDPAVVLERARGEPIYLLSAMTNERTMRMKPQNLLTGLPIRRLEVVS